MSTWLVCNCTNCFCSNITDIQQKTEEFANYLRLRKWKFSACDSDVVIFVLRNDNLVRSTRYLMLTCLNYSMFYFVCLSFSPLMIIVLSILPWLTTSLISLKWWSEYKRSNIIHLYFIHFCPQFKYSVGLASYTLMQLGLIKLDNFIS